MQTDQISCHGEPTLSVFLDPFDDLFLELRPLVNFGIFLWFGRYVSCSPEYKSRSIFWAHFHVQKIRLVHEYIRYIGCGSSFYSLKVTLEIFIHRNSTEILKIITKGQQVLLYMNGYWHVTSQERSKDTVLAQSAIFSSWYPKSYWIHNFNP